MTFIHTPPPYWDTIKRLGPDGLERIFGAALTDGEYLHWHELRHRTPPDGLSHEEWWAGLKLGRQSKRIPLIGVDGQPAAYSCPSRMMELLHFIDQHCAGEIAIEEPVITDDTLRRRYLVSSIMEEAIRSSQLEGATTSRRRAKRMLESGARPQNRSERMIVNAYNAMLHIRDLDGPLTPQDVLDLHRVVTDGTLDTPDAAGRLQLPEEERVAVFERGVDGRLLHTPPPAEELPQRLEALCSFANGENDTEFIHPVVRAILLHFWLGYDHPFEDGNGRTARALFYWSMRNQGYWLTEYLSISRILRNAATQYQDAFLKTETDASDTTYFLLYQLEAIRRAVDELHTYLKRKVAEVREVEKLLRSADDFNHRQIALLSHALRNVDPQYTYAGHARSHGVTHETARADLVGLEHRGLLERRRAGRRHIYLAPQDISERLKA